MAPGPAISPDSSLLAEKFPLWAQTFANNIASRERDLSSNPEKAKILELALIHVLSDCLTTAVNPETGFKVFDIIKSGKRNFDAVRKELDLDEKPAALLLGSLKALGLIDVTKGGILRQSALAQEAIDSDSLFSICPYLCLGGLSPDNETLTSALKDFDTEFQRPDLIALSKVFDAKFVSEEHTANAIALDLETDLPKPKHDATPLFDVFRLKHVSDLIAVAQNNYGLFYWIRKNECSFDRICEDCSLSSRSATVLLSALGAAGLIYVDQPTGAIKLTELGEQCFPDNSSGHLSNLKINSDSSGVKDTAQCIRTNKPTDGAQCVSHPNKESIMDDPATARAITECLASRAQHVSAAFEERLDLGKAKRLFSVGAGSGVFEIPMLEKNPDLPATLMDHKNVNTVAAEYVAKATTTDNKLHERVKFNDTNMLDADWNELLKDFQAGDIVLLSNVLHDYGPEDAAKLVKNIACAMPKGVKLVVHDAILNSLPTDMAMNETPVAPGPLEIAAYSYALFSITEGRAYSRSEYVNWAKDAGLMRIAPSVAAAEHSDAIVTRTNIQCGFIEFEKTA